jgi:DNA-binding CsgD family transcriptional regulator
MRPPVGKWRNDQFPGPAGMNRGDESAGGGDAVALEGPEIERVRQAFAELRLIAAATDSLLLRRQLREVCVRFAAVAGGRRRSTVLLTDREIDVLAQVGMGRRNAEIAIRMAVTAETVKSYLRSAMIKLGVHSRYAAVVAARDAGLLP